MPSGEEMREAAWSGPRAVEMGKRDTFELEFGEESRGLTHGSDLEVQERRDSWATPRRPAPWLCGKWEKILLSRCLPHHQHSKRSERARPTRPSFRRRGTPQSLWEQLGLAKLAMPVGSQGEPTCSAQGLLPLPPAVHEVPPHPTFLPRHQPYTELTALSATTLGKKCKRKNPGS